MRRSVPQVAGRGSVAAGRHFEVDEPPAMDNLGTCPIEEAYAGPDQSEH
jgi:hypothetical protein